MKPLDAIRIALETTIPPGECDVPYALFRIGSLLQNELGVYIGPQYSSERSESIGTEILDT